MSGTHTGRHTANNNRSHQINNDQLEGIMKQHMTQNGDGTGNKLGVIADAINTNTITQNGKIDTTNTKLDTLETTLTAIETDAAASEVLLTTLSNGQTQNGDGTGNKLGVMIDAINTNTITQNSKIDTTNTKLTTTNSKLATIETDIEGNGVVLTAIDSVLDTIKVDTAAIKTAVELLDNTVSGSELQVDIVSGSISLPSGAATEAKQDVIETTLTAIETDAAAIETLITSTNSKIDTFDAVLDASLVKQTAIETLITSTNSKIDTLDAVVDAAEVHLGAIDTATSSIQSNVATSSLQGTANGHLSNIVTSVQLIDDVVKAEDTAHVSGDKGIVLLGVRQSTQADFGADGDYVPLSIDDDGKVRVTGGSGGSGGATEAKQDVIETTLTNIETDAAAIEVLITATNSKIDTIDGVLDSSLVKQTAIETLITSTNSKIDTLDAVQDAAEVHLGNIETAVQLLDDTVKAEDAAHSSGDKGLHVLGVRNDTLAALAGADGDYASLQVDKNGGLYTNKTSGNTDLTFTGGGLIIPNNDTIYTDAIDVSQYSHYVIALNSADSSFTGCNIGIEYSPDNGTSFMGSKSSGASLPESANAEALYKPSGGGSGASLDSYGLFLGEGLQMNMTNPVRKASHIRVFVQAPNSGSTITLSKFSIFQTN